MADPGFPLNCPKYGARLVYVSTQDDTHVYRCAQHGLLILPPHGRVHLDDPNNPATIH